ncbi:hypothetical protein H310_01811 [Aphanomyces invadans]|uniref:Globin domain-containing protein n=1 Tax=Aphanomyces invadans TaxID=157072 RepID=A0A024UN13_9STRA|nr:hypothetical protein H310_01811 [Aphanomyces invadans]ETW07247.1 hypothetical protein H310_01811 [Aphanomyces invadans]RHY29618.1 hypothetical protein DYB32_009290 [Aphanomyces invadans]|eukprot:XP_008863340.1 hypothetical protein H310_01811 [Aphanomyces invadans]
MGIKYSVQAVTRNADGSLSLHSKYKRYLQAKCPDFAYTSCLVTPEITRLVMTNWDTITNGTAPGMKGIESPVVYFYDSFYNDLFVEDPSTKPLFRSSIIVQGKALINIVQSITHAVNSPQAIERVVDLAYRHNKYKVKMEYYNTLGRVLLTSLKRCSGGDAFWPQDLDLAWRTVYAYMLTAMTPIVYHGQIAPSAKEKEQAKSGKFTHTMTMRPPKSVKPLDIGAALPAGECPVNTLTSISPTGGSPQCPVQPSTSGPR